MKSSGEERREAAVFKDSIVNSRNLIFLFSSQDSSPRVALLVLLCWGLSHSFLFYQISSCFCLKVFPSCDNTDMIFWRSICYHLFLQIRLYSSLQTPREGQATLLRLICLFAYLYIHMYCSYLFVLWLVSIPTCLSISNVKVLSTILLLVSFRSPSLTRGGNIPVKVGTDFIQTWKHSSSQQDEFRCMNISAMEITEYHHYSTPVFWQTYEVFWCWSLSCPSSNESLLFSALRYFFLTFYQQ